MTNKRFARVAILTLLMSFSGSAQSASDLLQKGLHLQEAAGDVDGAIAFFRQVVSSASSANQPLAAQAQYQLVLCMLQKGDRTGAEKVLAALQTHFHSMRDLIQKAEKLLPGSTTLLPAPWGESECSQLNIKRDGAETGEFLYYSADAWGITRFEKERKEYAARVERSPIPAGQSDLRQSLFLRWELKTRKSLRSIEARVDRDTLQLAKPEWAEQGNLPKYDTNDDLGDPLAVPFTGPATDAEQSVFLLRRLPLAVGYQTKIPVTSNTIAPVQMELVVTGIESVQTIAGKFNCYKVSFRSIGQTFWIGVEGSRPLVKFQSGGVEAELVKTWGTEKLMEPLVQLMKDTRIEPVEKPGGMIKAGFYQFGNCAITIYKIYTAQPEIAHELQRMLDAKTAERHLNPLTDYKLRPDSLQTRTISGHPALACLLDYSSVENSIPTRKKTVYATWIGTEDEMIEFWCDIDSDSVGTFRWQLEPILAALHIP